MLETILRIASAAAGLLLIAAALLRNEPGNKEIDKLQDRLVVAYFWLYEHRAGPFSRRLFLASSSAVSRLILYIFDESPWSFKAASASICISAASMSITFFVAINSAQDYSREYGTQAVIPAVTIFLLLGVALGRVWRRLGWVPHAIALGAIAFYFCTVYIESKSPTAMGPAAASASFNAISLGIPYFAGMIALSRWILEVLKQAEESPAGFTGGTRKIFLLGVTYFVLAALCLGIWYLVVRGSSGPLFALYFGFLALGLVWPLAMATIASALVLHWISWPVIGRVVERIFYKIPSSNVVYKQSFLAGLGLTLLALAFPATEKSFAWLVEKVISKT